MFLQTLGHMVCIHRSFKPNSTRLHRTSQSSSFRQEETCTQTLRIMQALLQVILGMVCLGEIIGKGNRQNSAKMSRHSTTVHVQNESLNRLILRTYNTQQRISARMPTVVECSSERNSLIGLQTPQLHQGHKTQIRTLT